MKLRSYIIRRLLLIVPLFFFVTLLVFTLIHLAPGDPVMTMFGTTTPYMKDIVEQLTKEYGLDKPIYIQYLMWLGRLFRGDLGYSYLNSTPVIQMISIRIWPTLELMLVANFISIFLAVIFGVIAAVKPRSIIDNVITSLSVVGRGLPNFWIAMNLILIFSLNLRWLPVSGRITVGTSFDSPIGYMIDHLKHIILPALAISIAYLAYLVRLVRSTMLDVLNQDYIITARAKGLKESIVIYKHALKNTLIPLVTVVGVRMGYLFSGSAIIETIFAWPGMGRLLVNSVYSREYLLLMGINLIIILMVLFANLLTDIVVALLDPRVKY